MDLKQEQEIAKYCIQDCELCINLLLLLDIIPNNLAMANVSYVPASYIFLRGRDKKVTSVKTQKCAMNTKIPDLKPKPRMVNIVKCLKMVLLTVKKLLTKLKNMQVLESPKI